MTTRELLELLCQRRSGRQYTGESVPEPKLNDILRAGLLYASSNNIRPLRFILVRSRETLMNLSRCKQAGSAMLEHAAAAIVVFADTSVADAWVEDAAIAMNNMMLCATAEGVANCWVQCRNRFANAGEDARIPTDQYLRQLLDIPDGYAVEAILSLGMPAAHLEPHPLPDPAGENVMQERFTRDSAQR